MTHIVQRPIPGTEAYLRDRRQVFAEIRQLESLIAWRTRQPRWHAVGYDADGEPDVDANDRPWNKVHDARQVLATNPTVTEILGAQGRQSLLEA
ncbi:hypothetical protein [Gluconacetobacter azotocaptans]|uniref:hypothetical protein n=1 Tax=Gluconacetobacter azotocaptans TaxID=142834 RepID=UPI00195CCCC6|nr:hypothetical protein [Gluconacetobacter azotocaptans]